MRSTADEGKLGAPLAVFPGRLPRGIDSCGGDSGGPLFATTSAGTEIQVGIVSYGIGCAKQRYAGVYGEVNSPTIRSFIADVAGV